MPSVCPPGASFDAARGVPGSCALQVPPGHGTHPITVSLRGLRGSPQATEPRSVHSQ